MTQKSIAKTTNTKDYDVPSTPIFTKELLSIIEEYVKPIERIMRQYELEPNVHTKIVIAGVDFKRSNLWNLEIVPVDRVVQRFDEDDQRWKSISIPAGSYIWTNIKNPDFWHWGESADWLDEFYDNRVAHVVPSKDDKNTFYVTNKQVGTPGLYIHNIEPGAFQ